jgi:hypothetical protein
MRRARSLPVLLSALLLAACSGGSGHNRAGNAPEIAARSGTPAATLTTAATVSPAGQPPIGTLTPAVSTPPATPAPPGATARAAPSPTPVPAAAALYRALLSAPFPAEELPDGFAAPAVGPASFFINDLARANGVVGEVDVTLQGPDASNAIVYLIFPSAEAAQAVFDAQKPAPPYTNASSVDVPDAGFPLRCNSFAGDGPNGYQAGVTLCNGVLGEVEVAGFSQALYDLGSQPSGGNQDAALALVKAGAAHLATIRRSP